MEQSWYHIYYMNKGIKLKVKMVGKNVMKKVKMVGKNVIKKVKMVGKNVDWMTNLPLYAVKNI